MSIGISVIICCYNSSNRLPKTIEHLANQKIPASTSWELIIVDNNSTDNTDEVAAMEWSKYDCTGKFNIVKEENIGLSHARFRGVSHASFEYILFCDDDNWLQEDYIRKAINIIDSKPEIGVLGGQGIVKADTALPDWWEDFASSYAVGKQNETSGIVDERGYLWGAGMVTKKKLYLDAYNGFPSLLSDRKGTILNSGGDSEYCARVLLMGYSLYYSEDLTFFHYMDPQRLTWGYKKKMFEGHQESQFILNCYRQIISRERKPFIKKIGTIVKFPFKVLKCSLQLNKKGLQLALKDLYLDWQFDFIPFQHNTLKKVVAIKKKIKKKLRSLHA